ncbi:hypothetical protein DD237_003555 [Peronospora effusa]|uniref:Uncharacterized protein n=1 Tax=Peronospora effusa TaxID=542832 RepID=A0A425BXH6_9STRA|nr:hypothetical protein DD237_003555 [Peronospora effusa]
MLFHLDDKKEEKTRERALAIFEDVVGPNENAHDSDLQKNRYRIAIKTPIQFHMIVGFVGGGSSFRMASRFMHLTKKQAGLTSLGSASEGKVTSIFDMSAP